LITNLDEPLTQDHFAFLVGLSRPRIGQLIDAGVLTRGATGRQWLLEYCERIRVTASGREEKEPDEGALDLNKEKALLARAQRFGHEDKRKVHQGLYASITLLADVLATASAAVVAKFEQLEGTLRKVCPDLPDPARQAIMQTIAAARNEWVRSTAELISAKVDAATEDPDAEDDPA